VTILAALEKPTNLPEQWSDAFAEAFPQQAGDTNINNMLAWLYTVDGQTLSPMRPPAPA